MHCKHLPGRNTLAYFIKMFYSIVTYGQLWKTFLFDIDALAKWVSMFVPGTYFQRNLMFLIKQYYYTYLLQCKYLPRRNTLAYFTKLFNIDALAKWVSTYVPGTHFQRSLIFLVWQNFALWLWCKYLPGRNTLAYFTKCQKCFLILSCIVSFEKKFSSTLTLQKNEWVCLSLEHSSSVV